MSTSYRAAMEFDRRQVHVVRIYHRIKHGSENYQIVCAGDDVEMTQFVREIRFR